MSRSLRKSAPARIPEEATSHGIEPAFPLISRAGMMRLQTEAAIMMPAAKPSESVSARGDSRPGRMRNTVAAPATVHRNVKPV